MKNEFDAKKKVVEQEFESELTSDVLKSFLKTGKIEITKHNKTLTLDSKDIIAARKFKKEL